MRPNIISIAGSCLAIAAAVYSVPAVAQVQSQDQVRPFNIPVQEASSGIRLFAQQAGIQVIASSEATAGVRTRALNGRFSVRDGLNRLIAGTGLVVLSFDGNVAMLGRDAQTADQSDAASDIVVLGTRRVGRTAAQSTVPVDVFNIAEIETQPSEDMNEILRSLVPSFAVDRFAVNDGSTFIRPPTLRGLPPDEVLVMVNGKRRHRSALVNYGNGSQGVDMAMIPSIAIERIELLRDGASAQYGSDAIAGVFNYTLRRNTDGLLIQSRYGQFYQGDGKTAQIAANLGLPLTANGFFNVSAEYAGSGQTSRGATPPGAWVLSHSDPAQYGDIPDPAQIWGNPRSHSVKSFFNSAFEVGEDMEVYAFGSYADARYDSDFNYRMPIGVYGPDKFGNGNSTYYGQAGSIFANLYTRQIPGMTDVDGNPVFDGTGPTYNLRSLYPQGFTPRFFGHITDASLVTGFRGSRGDFTWDLSAAYGQNQIEYRLKNSLNPSMGPDTPTEFYMGALEQRETNFNADFTYAWDVGMFSPVVFGFGGEHRHESYEIKLGDPASYENGIYGHQTVMAADGSLFKNSAQGIGSNGFQGFGPGSVVDEGRNNYAIYAQVEADPIRGLTLNAALRHENFSDFGTTTNWKLAGLYQVAPWMSVRGAVSTGFRAPTPGQLYETQITYSWVGSDPLESAVYPVTNAAAQAFGAQPLEPEKSTNISAGVVFTPMRGLTLTVDYYRIDVDDRIGLTGFLDINTEARRQALRDAGISNAETLYRLRYFTNAYSTRTQGVDFVGNYAFENDIGNFEVTLAANYNTSKVTDTVPLLVLGQPYYVIDPNVIGNVSEGTPKWRGYLTGTWAHGPWRGLARVNYYDGWTVYDIPANGGVRSFGSDATLDLEFSYRLTEFATLAIGASNILDNYPDKDTRAGDGGQNYYSFTGGQSNGKVYPENAPYGYNGGFWYARLNFNF